MKLRTKLALLIAIVFFASLLIAAALRFIDAGTLSEVERQRATAVSSTQRWVTQELVPAWPLVAAGGEVPMPEGRGLVVVDASGVVLLSSWAAADPGDRVEGLLDGDHATSPLGGRLGRAPWSQPVFVDSVLAGAVYREPPRLPLGFRWRWLVENGRWGLLSLLVVGALAVGLFAGSIRHRLRTIQDATARVAQGDLHSPVTVTGNDELADLSHAFERMRTALKAQHDALSRERNRQHRFLLAVSHDLRTPLTSIKGYLEAVADDMAPDAASRERYLSLAAERVELLEARITELNAVLRIRSEDWNLQLSDRCLSGELRRLTASYSEDLELLGKKLHVDLGALPTDTTVSADWTLFSRVTDNLIQNAVVHAPGDEPVEFVAWVDATTAVVEVRDHGLGIPDDQIARVFEPFFRGARNGGGQEGGLGLTAARSIAEAHGWALTATSPPGSGAIFRLTIYLSDEDHVAPELGH